MDLLRQKQSKRANSTKGQYSLYKRVVQTERSREITTGQSTAADNTDGLRHILLYRAHDPLSACVSDRK